LSFCSAEQPLVASKAAAKLELLLSKQPLDASKVAAKLELLLNRPEKSPTFSELLRDDTSIVV
jgi:hypothetical protein